MSRHPTVLWAQRSDKLFITVELPDAKNLELKLEPEGKFFFSATAGADDTPYEVEFDLFDKVDVNGSKASITSRNICYLVKKAENKWWDRLLKQGGKSPIFLKVDWNKWVDEDEQEEKDDKLGSDMDFGDFDFSKLNMGGDAGDFDADIADDKDEGDDDDSDTEEEDEDENEIKEGVAGGGEPHTKPAGGGESETKA